MDLVQFLLVAVLVVVVVALVSAPLRDPARDGDSGQADRAGLEAVRAAKYREIREAELDMRTGKLERADWVAIDRRLRAEAMEVLRALDRLGPPPPRAGSQETS